MIWDQYLKVKELRPITYSPPVLTSTKASFLSISDKFEFRYAWDCKTDPAATNLVDKRRWYDDGEMVSWSSSFFFSNPKANPTPKFLKILTTKENELILISRLINHLISSHTWCFYTMSQEEWEGEEGEKQYMPWQLNQMRNDEIWDDRWKLRW